MITQSQQEEIHKLPENQRILQLIALIKSRTNINERPFIMKIFTISICTVSLFSSVLADYDYGGAYDYNSDSTEDSTAASVTSAKTTTTEAQQNDFQLFESVAEIIRHTKAEIENIKEHPFLAEEKAFQVLNKIKGFKWPKKDRKRKLFDSNVESVCVEEVCNLEEMNEDYENWPVSKIIGDGKVPQESFDRYLDCYKSMDTVNKVRSGYKTRNSIRKQCLPYEWNKVGLPDKVEEHQ